LARLGHYGIVALGALRTATDVDLAARCAAGDRAAQRELFDREVDHIHAALHRILGPARDIEDLVQETFLEVFRSLAGYRGDAQLKTWIGRVTARVAYRYLSSRRRAPASLDDHPEPAADVPGMEQRALARDAVRRLYAILGELHSSVRLAFILQVLEGQTLEEVAAAMNCSVIATKSRVWRARRRLRRDPIVSALLEGAREPEEP
jgi:RNA polymerase sigma-70 factor (ECF subfamily)